MIKTLYLPDPSLNIYTDKVLLERIAEGNEAAFTSFFRATSPQILTWTGAVLHHKEAEKEVLQEVFIRIWLNREQLPHIEFLTAWLKKLTLNRSFTYLQAEARRQARESHAPGIGEQTDPIEQLSYRELLAVVEEAVAALPPQRRQIYRMSREKGMSPAEIADALQLSPGTVRNATSMALSAIREHLQASGKYVPLFLLFLK